MAATRICGGPVHQLRTRANRQPKYQGRFRGEGEWATRDVIDGRTGTASEVVTEYPLGLLASFVGLCDVE